MHRSGDLPEVIDECFLPIQLKMFSVLFHEIEVCPATERERVIRGPPSPEHREP